MVGAGAIGVEAAGNNKVQWRQPLGLRLDHGLYITLPDTCCRLCRCRAAPLLGKPASAILLVVMPSHANVDSCNGIITSSWQYIAVICTSKIV